MCILDGPRVRTREGGHRVDECDYREVGQATALDAGAGPLAQGHGSVPVLIVDFDQCELGETEGLYVRGCQRARTRAVVQGSTSSWFVADQVVGGTREEPREGERVAAL